MKATLTGDNAGDFQQRHQKTYGFFHKPNGERMLVYVKSVSSHECKFESSDGQSFTAFANAGVEFEFLPVMRGWWDTSSGRAVHFDRVPARQFQRGISRQNTEIYTFDLIGRLQTAPLDFKTLEDVFIPKHDVYESGVVRWKKEGKILAALGRHFAVDDNYVYFHLERIGTVENNKKSFKLISDLYLQEVMDAARRCALEVEVSANV